MKKIPFLFLVILVFANSVHSTALSETGTNTNGNVYNPATIGEQNWLKENLKTTSSDDGIVIPLTSSNPLRSNLNTAGHYRHNEQESIPLHTSLSQEEIPPINYMASKAHTVAGTYSDLGSNGAIISTPDFDNSNSAAQNIGFSFNFNNQSFTQFILNTNGFIKLGNSTPSTASLFFDGANTAGAGVFNSSDPADVNLIVPFNHDLTSGTGTPEYRLFTSGVAPNRICAIQFENVRDKTTSPAQQFDNIEFQIKLYETSNIIEFVYGNWIASGNASAFKTSACGLKGSGNEAKFLLVVNKGSNANWNAVSFTNANYSTTATLNFGNPSRPLPDVGRTFRFIPIYGNDLMVGELYSLAEASSSSSNPQTISVNILNSGSLAQSNIPVSLTVTGANSYSDTRSILLLNPGESRKVSFSGFTASQNGLSEITISLPDDDYTSDNIRKSNQLTTDTALNYSSGSSYALSFGFGAPDGFSGVLYSRYHVNGTASITSVNAFIANDAAGVGKVVYGLVLDQNGNIIGKSPDYTIQAGDLNSWHTFSLISPPTVSESDFYAGFALTAAGASAAYYVIAAQSEKPARANAFYESNIDGSELIQVDTTTFNYRFMIGANVYQQQSSEYTSVLSYFHPTAGGTYPDQPFIKPITDKEVRFITKNVAETWFAIWDTVSCLITIQDDNTVSYELTGNWNYTVYPGDPNDASKISHYDPVTGKIYLYYYYAGSGGNRIFWEELTPPPPPTAPTALSTSSPYIPFKVKEGTIVAALYPTDINKKDTHTIELVSGYGDHEFFTVSGNLLKTAADINLSQVRDFSIKVKVTDNTGLSSEFEKTISATSEYYSIVSVMQQGDLGFLQDIYLTGQSTVWVKDNLNRVLRSTDGGSSWNILTIPSGLNYLYGPLFAVDENTAWLLVSQGEPGIYQTKNGGVSWTKQETAYSTSSFPDIVYFWNANEGFTMGDKDAQGFMEIYTTENGGTSWNRVPQENINSNMLSTLNTQSGMSVYKDTVWVSGNNGRIFRSTDKGQRWDAFQTPASSEFTLEFMNGQTGIISQAGTSDTLIYVTLDGGISWNSKETGFESRSYRQYLRRMPGTDYLILSNGNTFYFSEDLGSTWQPAGFNLPFMYDFSAVVNQNLWAAGGLNRAYNIQLEKILPCKADFDFVENPVAGTVSFTSSSFAATVYEWDFGTGDISDLPNPDYAFSNTGTYDVCLTVTNNITNTQSTACKKVVVTSVVNSIRVPESNASLEVLPNPVQTQAIINFKSSTPGEVRLELYNQLGQKVSTIYKGFPGSEINTLSWSVNDLPEGVYYIQLNSATSSVMKKLLITR